MSRTILVVDDDPAIRLTLGALLRQAGYEHRAVGDGAAALEAADASVGAVLTDVRMPGMDGMTLLARLRAERPSLPVVVLTGHGDISMAVDAMKLGASDFFVKPIEREKLLSTLARLLPAVDEAEAIQPELSERIGLWAASAAPLLLVGESGSGRTFVARRIHAASPSATEPFVELDMGAVVTSLFESLLFGHVRGAFSGADQAADGVLRAAGSGTVLLRGIDQMPMAVQPKLLRALQERQVVPVGGVDPLPIRARLMATAEPTLATAMEEGRFRRDLFYRLAVLQVDVPPLRAWVDALPSLMRSMWTSERPWPEIGDGAWSVWRAHPWPGNLVELRSLTERLAAMQLDRVDEAAARRLLGTHRRAEPLDLDRERARTEAEVIRQAIRDCDGNKAEAARLLGISRGTLYNKLRKLEELSG